MGLSAKDYKEIYPRLYAYAMSLCRNNSLAEDLVSQTIIAAVENLDAGTEVRDLTAWCVTVLRNRYLDFVKKKKEAQLDPVTPEDERAEDFSAGMDSFSNILFGECMEKIEPKHAEVMIMSVLKGMRLRSFLKCLANHKHNLDMVE